MSRPQISREDAANRLAKFSKAYTEFATVFEDYVNNKPCTRGLMIAALALADFYMTALYREWSEQIGQVKAKPPGSPKLRLLLGGKNRLVSGVVK